MDDKAVEEATRLGLLERLEARPASVEELARWVLWALHSVHYLNQ
jgi:hypothetical protein